MNVLFGQRIPQVDALAQNQASLRIKIISQSRQTTGAIYLASALLAIAGCAILSLHLRNVGLSGVAINALGFSSIGLALGTLTAFFIYKLRFQAKVCSMMGKLGYQHIQTLEKNLRIASQNQGGYVFQKLEVDFLSDMLIYQSTKEGKVYQYLVFAPSQKLVETFIKTSGLHGIPEEAQKGF